MFFVFFLLYNHKKKKKKEKGKHISRRADKRWCQKLIELRPRNNKHDKKKIQDNSVEFVIRDWRV